MQDPEAVDEALELAIERTIEAQDRYETTPLTAPEIVPVAEAVVRRAEDLTVLADEAEEVTGVPASGRREG